MQFSNLAEFDKEYEALCRRFITLPEDFSVLKKLLLIYPKGIGSGVFRIAGLGIKTEVYKVKHFRCKAMQNKGSRSGIRVVYAYIPEEEKIEFVEIYYKEKDNLDCDKKRIKKYYL
jgi:hypothetical protein